MSTTGKVQNIIPVQSAILILKNNTPPLSPFRDDSLVNSHFEGGCGGQLQKKKPIIGIATVQSPPLWSLFPYPDTMEKLLFGDVYS